MHACLKNQFVILIFASILWGIFFNHESNVVGAQELHSDCSFLAPVGPMKKFFRDQACADMNFVVSESPESAQIFPVARFISTLSGPFGETAGFLQLSGMLPAFHFFIWAGVPDPVRSTALAATLSRLDNGKESRLAFAQDYPLPTLEILSAAELIKETRALGYVSFPDDENVPSVFTGALTVKALPLGVVLISLPLTSFGQELATKHLQSRVPFGEEFLTLRLTYSFTEKLQVSTSGALPCLRADQKMNARLLPNELQEWGALFLGNAYSLIRCQP